MKIYTVKRLKKFLEKRKCNFKELQIIVAKTAYREKRNKRLSASKNKPEMSKRNGRRGHGRGGGGPRSRRAVVADDSQRGCGSDVRRGVLTGGEDGAEATAATRMAPSRRSQFYM